MLYASQFHFMFWSQRTALKDFSEFGDVGDQGGDVISAASVISTNPQKTVVLMDDEFEMWSVCIVQ